MELICTSEFLKKLKLYEPLHTKMRKFVQKNCRKMFLEAIFSYFKKRFSGFPYKIFVTALHYIIGLQNFSLSFCQSLSRITMYNLHWCYPFCTGVTLFAPVLHLNYLLSAESNFFMCIIKCIILQDLLPVFHVSVFLRAFITFASFSR